MVVPFLALGFAAWQAWGGVLRWPDLVVLVVAYALSGVGITVGFHRLYTHRSFKTRPALRLLFGALGSAALEGPLIEWVSNHRKHHQFSDDHGDPTAHTVNGGRPARGVCVGLAHAIVGWILRATPPPAPERYAKDLSPSPSRASSPHLRALGARGSRAAVLRSACS